MVRRDSGLTALRYFDASHNGPTGAIPPLAGLTSLATFLVDENNLTGSIPDLSGLTSLRLFAVSRNHLSGALPALAGLPKLEYFTAWENDLAGPLPDLSSLANLRIFDASDNHLIGAIPPLAGLGNLQIFRVGSNNLSGDAPAVPSPNALRAGSSLLCPNALHHAPSADWDAATGWAPWYAACADQPILQGAASRKLHANVGSFDLPLSDDPWNPTTEPRGGAGPTLVFTLQVNARLAQFVDASSFAFDVNLSGTLSLADLLLVNGNLAHSLPTP